MIAGVIFFGNPENDPTYTYTYDYENRLTGATKTGMSATYTYDAFGRRTQKNVDGTITNFIYDGDQVIVETDATGSTTAKYIYGPGIDEPISMEKGGETYYYHFDGLGSVTALTHSSGSSVETYTYDAYGQPNTSSSIGNSYMFTGRSLDSETNLYYYRARYYSPSDGRFLQTDPIGYWGGINLYTYCNNDPINWIDPYGLDKEGGNEGNFPGGNMPPGPDGEPIGPTGPEDPAPEPPTPEEDTPEGIPGDPTPEDPTPFMPTWGPQYPEEYTRKSRWWEWILYYFGRAGYEHLVPQGYQGPDLGPVPPTHKDYPGPRELKNTDYTI